VREMNRRQSPEVKIEQVETSLAFFALGHSAVDYSETRCSAEEWDT
jgi:hypothetical protein